MDLVLASPEADQRRDVSQKLAGVGCARELWSEPAAPASPELMSCPGMGVWGGRNTLVPPR